MNTGITTYEPTWLHLAALFLLVVVLTYPLSLGLSAIGVLERSPMKGAIAGAFDRANQILAVQSQLFVFAWASAAAASFAVLMSWVLIGGALVAAAIMEPVNQLLGTELLVLMLAIHVIAQAMVYLYAVKATSPLEQDASH